MTQTSQASTGKAARWQRLLVAILIVLTVACGVWGHWNYEREHHHHHGETPDVVSVVYHSLQLLIAHGVHLDGHIPWQLQAARILGVTTVFLAGMIAFAKFFRHEWLMWQLWAPWRSNHVLICGLGDLGLGLAIGLRREERKFVVAVEQESAAADIEKARQAGVLVLIGDARDPSVLRKARIERADFLVAACPDDATNIAIAAAVDRLELTTKATASPFVCRLMLRDPELRRVFEAQALFSHVNRQNAGDSVRKVRINLCDLNLEEVAARQALRRHPLDFEPIRRDDETIAHVVIAGFGPMGQSCALHAVRVAQFANTVTNARPMRLTIVDRNGKALADDFHKQFPNINELCDISVCDEAPKEADTVEILRKLSLESKQHNELMTYVICFEEDKQADDRKNFRVGLNLSKLARDLPVQTLIYQHTRSGFAALFPAESESSRITGRVHAFGMIEDVYSHEVLLRESEDKLARALHADFVKHRLAENRLAERKTVENWEGLSDGMKDSNRHAADHISTKLRALGYHDGPLDDSRARITEFTAEDVHLLAPLEHRRWCVERWLDGWELGKESDRPKKISRDQIDWDSLPEAEKKKDYEQIRAIPGALYGIGRGIYR